MNRKQFDPTLPRRAYWLDECADPGRCPECGGPLIQEYQSYIFATKRGKEIEPYATGNPHGSFCPACPVAVLDGAGFTEVAAMKAEGSAKFLVLGTVRTEDLNKEDLHVGKFTWQHQKPLAAQAAKPGRNDPCPCGSGKKYKKCCGK